MARRVAQVLGQSSGGIRRLVKYLLDNPPPGYETAGVVAPSNLAEYFGGWPFRALEGFRPWAPLRPDIVHAHGFTAGVHAVVSESAARLSAIGRASDGARQGRVGVVVTIHSAPSQTLRAQSAGSRLGPAQKLLWRGGRMIAERSDALIAPSLEVARSLRGATVIAPAIELPGALESRQAVRADLGTPGEKVVALAVGRLHRDKALDIFIEAVAGTGAEGWIAGEGPERPKLEALAAGTGVRLLGERSDVGSLLGAADVFALPASGEAYGFAVMEALAAGLPIVATRTGAIPELVGEAGVLVDPGDREGFVKATRALLNDVDRRMKLAELARRRPLPAPQKLAAEVGRVYDRVISDFRGRAGLSDENMT